MTNRQTLSDMKAAAVTLRGQIEKDRKRLRSLHDKINRAKQKEELSAALNVADGVTIRHGASRRELRGKPATVRKVNRTRAVVEVAGEKWSFPFELIHCDSFAAELEAELNRSATESP